MGRLAGRFMCAGLGRVKGGRRNWKWRWVVVTHTQFISWFENETCKKVNGDESCMRMNWNVLE